MDKEKIAANFGLDFYEKVRSNLEKYSELWGLSDFEEIDNYTWSCYRKVDGRNVAIRF